MQIMREIAMFFGKIYTAGTNFTRLLVVTVATNLNSVRAVHLRRIKSEDKCASASKSTVECRTKLCSAKERKSELLSVEFCKSE